MKKRFLSVAAAVLAVAAMSCSKNDNNDTTTPPVTSDTLGGLKGDTLWGKIRMNITLEANKTYYLDGPTFVKSGYTLTVNAGAKILAIKKGRTTRSASNSFLVVTRGAKLVAEGTATSPIVFSSAEAKGARATSDWGGLMILGKAPVNTTFNGAVGRQMEGFSDNDASGYGDDIVGGGSDAADNSGVLKYVRVEFAGIALSNKANSELNSITFIGVGNGTTIDYVQSSFSGDDSFEWFGGTVNAKHLIAYRGLDDDFDTDNGFSGKVQFGLSIRDKDISDYALPGDSNGFESDNDETGTGSTPTTSPVFSNFTILGPAAINGGANIPATAVFNRSAHIRRNSRLSLFNSALAGFVTGLLIDGDKSAAVAGNDSLEIKNTFIGAIGGVKSGAAGKKVTSNVGTFDAGAWFMKAGFNNDTTINTIDGFKFTNMSGELNTIDARPASGSPLLNKASFTSSTKISNSFFTVVTYAGAFSGSSDTWATGWTNFDPKNATY